MLIAHCSLSNAHCSVLSLCLKHQHHLESRNLHQRYLFRINHLLRQQQLQHLLQQQLALQHQPPAQAHLKHLLKSISQHMQEPGASSLSCNKNPVSDSTNLIHAWVVCCSHVDSFTSAKYYVLSFVLNNMVLVMQGPPPRARLDLYIKGNNELKASTIL